MCVIIYIVGESIYLLVFEHQFYFEQEVMSYTYRIRMHTIKFYLLRLDHQNSNNHCNSLKKKNVLSSFLLVFEDQLSIHNMQCI